MARVLAAICSQSNWSATINAPHGSCSPSIHRIGLTSTVCLFLSRVRYHGWRDQKARQAGTTAYQVICAAPIPIRGLGCAHAAFRGRKVLAEVDVAFEPILSSSEHACATRACSSGSALACPRASALSSRSCSLATRSKTACKACLSPFVSRAIALALVLTVSSIGDSRSTPARNFINFHRCVHLAGH